MRKENTEMFTKEVLETKKKDELMEIAKQLGVVRYIGKSALTKSELISSILVKQKTVQKNEQNDSCDVCDDVDCRCCSHEQKATIKEAKTSVIEKVKQLKKRKNPNNEEERLANKLRYIEEAAIGTLLAFRTETGKVKSAMIVNRSTKSKKFKVETKYGLQHVVHFDDVIWVRTNKRWPKGVYNLLKGIDGEVQNATN